MVCQCQQLSFEKIKRKIEISYVKKIDSLGSESLIQLATDCKSKLGNVYNRAFRVIGLRCFGHDEREKSLTLTTNYSSNLEGFICADPHSF